MTARKRTETAKRAEQLTLFENRNPSPQEAGGLDELSVEVRRVVDIMRECERSLSFFAVDCGLSPGERAALWRAADALARRLENLTNTKEGD